MTTTRTMHDENRAPLARVEGQIRGIRRMIESGQYCIDIITQLQAARAALQTISRRILRKHLEQCVSESFRAGRPDAARRKIDELIETLRRMERS